MREPKSSISSKGWQTEERGVALIIALLALTVLTGIGFAIMVSSSTESLINASFRRAGLALYSSVGGVEEMRGRMGPDAVPVTTSAATSVKIPCTGCALLYDQTQPLSVTNPNLTMGYYIGRASCRERV